MLLALIYATGSASGKSSQLILVEDVERGSDMRPLMELEKRWEVEREGLDVKKENYANE